MKKEYFIIETSLYNPASGNDELETLFFENKKERKSFLSKWYSNNFEFFYGANKKEKQKVIHALDVDGYWRNGDICLIHCSTEMLEESEANERFEQYRYGHKID